MEAVCGGNDARFPLQGPGLLLCCALKAKGETVLMPITAQNLEKAKIAVQELCTEGECVELCEQQCMGRVYFDIKN